jgi:hypothetical protein
MFLLKFHAQTICHAVHEREVGNDESRVQDRRVAPAGFPQRRKIFLHTGGGLLRQFRSEIKQGALRRRDTCFSIVRTNRGDKPAIFRFFAEALRMMSDSIVAVVRF